MTRAINFLLCVLAVTGSMLLDVAGFDMPLQIASHRVLELLLCILALAAHSFTPDGDKL